MLRSIKQFYGDKLVASDADIGHVKDLYFDDQQWIVRYVVVDTGSWLSKRSVLIPPHAFNNFHEYGCCLRVSLTRKQIENSPAIESHKPISRQYENEYFRYYGWPPYWQGGEMWGPGGFPMDPPPHFQPSEQSARSSGPHKGDDPHLRSTKALQGYRIQTSDGEIGRVTDFLMDDRTRVIRQCVVETGHWLTGKEIVIPTSDIDRISYEESKVFMHVTKEFILHAPEYHAPVSQF